MTDQKTTILELKEMVKEFVDEREWNQYHNTKNLSMAIAIESSELMEELLWESSEAVAATLEKKRENIENEAADILFALLALCNTCDINLAKAFARKIEINRKKYPIDQFKGKSLKYNQ
ncbi:MAG: nucleotide pyrophosphohydrolase [Candidatus Dependentiae bacterium]